MIKLIKNIIDLKNIILLILQEEYVLIIEKKFIVYVILKDLLKKEINYFAQI